MKKLLTIVALLGCLLYAGIARAEKNYVTVLVGNPANERIIRNWFASTPELHPIVARSEWIVMNRSEARFADYHQKLTQALKKKVLMPCIVVQRPDGAVLLSTIDGRDVPAVFAGPECRLDLLKEYLPDMALGLKSRIGTIDVTPVKIDATQLTYPTTDESKPLNAQGESDDISRLFPIFRRNYRVSYVEDACRPHPFRKPKPCPSPNDTPEPDPEPTIEPIIQQPVAAPAPEPAKGDASLGTVLAILGIGLVGLVVGVGSSFFKEVRG